MSDDYTALQRAAGKIRLGIERLAGQFPFHVALLERFKVQERADISTMAVTVSGDDVLLLFNPEFVLRVTADELGAVLLHEVHHVLFEHVLANPADYPDQWARTVAEEVTVNEFVPLPLPGAPITLGNVPGLPAMESTRERYERLKKNRRRGQIESPATQSESGCGSQGNQDSNSAGKQVTARSRLSRSSASDSPSVRDRDRNETNSKGHRRPRVLSETVDDHSVWNEARQDPERSRQAIRKVVEVAVLEVGMDQLPDELKAAVMALGIGTEPGRVGEQLQGDGVGRLDWRHLLRRYVGHALEVRPTFNRPPRRFPELVGILPGRSRRASRPKILAILDTSGSVTPDLLVSIDAELAGLARRFLVTVVECDAAVQRVYPYRGRLKSVLGRGGTDLRPPLEGDFLRRHRADLIIYFTDGLGPAPVSRPRTTLIWCVTPGGVRPAKWGCLVRMHMLAIDR